MTIDTCINEDMALGEIWHWGRYGTGGVLTIDTCIRYGTGGVLTIDTCILNEDMALGVF